MNVASTSRCFCLVVFFGYGYIFHLTDSLSVNDVYTDNNAEFTCVISPYTGSQRWYIDSVIVAFCGAIVCSTEPTNPVRYNFTHNVGTGTFIFKIDPTERTDHNKIIGCFDGTDTETLTINLPDKDQNKSSITNTTSTTVNIPIKKGVRVCGTLCIVLICVAVVIFIFLLIIIHYCVRPKLINIKLEDKKVHLEWTDCLNCCLCCHKIFGYNIVCKPTQGTVKDRISLNEFPDKTHCKLENLNPLAIYEISLSRTLGCCKSLETKRSVITRKEGMPDDQECHAKPTSIEVRWTTPDCVSNAQLKYKVACNAEVKMKDINQTQYAIEELTPGKKYKIEVFAVYKGTDILILEKQISTMSYTPVNFTYTIKATEIEFRWKKPECSGNQRLEYKVTCNKKTVTKTENTSCKIENIKPSQKYDIRIFTIINEKNGMKSLPLHRTIRIQPSLPKKESDQNESSTDDL